MSMKRQATTDLNHENWDRIDPSEHEKMGSFTAAPKEVIEKRVIRTAKRRSQIPSDEGKKSVFSGFGGFNKTQPSSFDFLAKLTNGNRDTNNSTKSDTSVTSSLFTSKPLSSSPGSGLFGIPSTTPTKLTFGMPTSQPTPLFDGPSVKTDTIPPVFTASKADSTVHDSPFKIQPVSSSVDTNFKDFTTSTTASTPIISSTIFGVSSTSANISKSLFSMTNSTPFKIQPVSSTTAVKSNMETTKTVSNANESENKVEDKPNDKKMKYYAKLKGLNESVSDWIKKHVEQTPLCILSPIFKDYEKYLKEIQDEYQSSGKEDADKSNKESTVSDTQSDLDNATPPKTMSALSNTKPESTVINTGSPNSKGSVFSTQNTSTGGKTSSFSFGINNSTGTSPNTTITNTGFSFGVNTTTQSTVANAAPFALSTNATASPNSGSPFAFGMKKPFSFNSNIQKNFEIKNNDNEDEEEAPKVDFIPVVEENSVYDKRCKIFVKKDGNFVDKGVGTLYVKKVEENGKYQLLVRANTNLGNVLVNLILASAIPTQRMGKNNVMMVCIPTPDSKPPPTPILIRVKSAEEADELLETLNKYKK